MDYQSVLNPDEWINNYADALYAYVLARVPDKYLAEDIVQNTFLSAWKGRLTYSGQASEKNWLYAICKNKIIDHFRSKAPVMAFSIEAREEDYYFDGVGHWTEEESPKEWSVDFEQAVDNKEFYTVLETCKKKLKEIQQAVFVMKYMEDVDADEICATLKITSANYWILVHRAKLHLRKCLEKNWIN